ncbi:MAG: hypothetical protein HYV07_10015 [Deltaproteobacteria bacterium]|nr:hypothetical protein [Deltaproteobacteria bacterium]
MSIPTALSVIELLQFLRKVRGLEPGERPPAGTFRVAILVSAWDAIDPSWRAQGPTKWLAQEMALFEDTLWSNFRREDTFRFGLSSTGGDLRNESYRRDFGGGGFVEWADSTGVVRHTRDLALPLYWALFGDLALATARE